MILVCGIPSEKPLVAVCAALNDLGAPYVLFNQRAYEQMAWHRGGFGAGHVTLEGRRFSLESFTGVFLRLMDYRDIPEFVADEEDSESRHACVEMHDSLLDWTEETAAAVINRPTAMGSNGSKPYQLQLIKATGLNVPDTLVANDPHQVEAFLAQHDRVIYKSISGARSIVKTLTPGDRRRLNEIRWCPTQFQECIIGIDVRVHVVGNEVFATAIESDTIDYRYADAKCGESRSMYAYELSDDIAQKCLQVSNDLGLSLSGIDLLITADGEAYCLEVNPCPGFSFFEAQTGQHISAAIAKFLAGRT